MCRKIDYTLLSSMLMQRHLGGSTIGDSLMQLSSMAEDLERQISKLTFDKQQLEIRLTRAQMKNELLDQIIDRHFKPMIHVDADDESLWVDSVQDDEQNTE